jgi:uncharacterized repeat protein (TIGR01451 family)
MPTQSRILALVSLLCLVPAIPATAVSPRPKLPVTAIAPAEVTRARPPVVSSPVRTAGPDTLRYGYYTMINGDPYAVPGEAWTFDHGAADPLEGWTAEDLSTNPAGYFRVVTPATWAGHGNYVPCPRISPAGTGWLGRFQDEATAACYVDGLGYGNNWAQRYTSPLFSIAGADDLVIRFKYFSNMEQNYDRVVVKVVFPNGNEVTCGDPITGVSGNPADSTWADGLFSVPAAQLAGQTQCQIRFAMTSDDVYSDQDGVYPTEYGPFGFARMSVRRNGPLLAEYLDQGIGLVPQCVVNGGVNMAQLGKSVCVLDVNQDGFDDVIVGEPQYTNGQSQEGRVLCFHGGPGGISSTPSWSYESNIANAGLGASVAGGVANLGSPTPVLLVGAPMYSNGQSGEGRIYLFGTTAGVGLGAAPIWTYESNVAGAQLGYSVTCGDANGNFYLVAGAPYYSNGQSHEGALYGWSVLDLGGPPTWLRESNQVESYLGTYLTWVEDATFGSYLVVGNPWYDGIPGADCGTIEIRTPSTGLVAQRAVGTHAGAGLGLSVAALGDFDGDGGTDLAVAAGSYTTDPALYIYNAEGTSYLSFYTALEDPGFGPTISAVGRLDDDLTGDIAMGGSPSGEVRLIDLDLTPGIGWAEQWSVGTTGSVSLISLAGAGDVNNDGHNDLVIGIPDYSANGSNRGRLQLHLWGNIGGADWVAAPIPGVGTQVGTAPVSAYALPSGACDMQGNVMEIHSQDHTHPSGQHVRLYSPIVDLTALPPDHDIHAVHWDAYDDNPLDSGLLVTYGWSYYPWTCPLSGQVGWSPPGGGQSGNRTWYFGGSPGCWSVESGSETANATEVPATAQKMRFYLEALSSCETFGVPPGNCLPADFSPLFDNLVLEEIDGGSVAGVVQRSTSCVGNYPKVPNVAVSLSPGGQVSLTDNNGRFAFYNLTPGAYTVTVTPPPNYSFQCGQPVVWYDGAPVRNVRYGIYPVANIVDLSVALAGGQAKPGFESRYGITCTNPGTIPATAPVTLHLPAAVSFVSADGGGTYEPSDHTVRWSLVTLSPQHSQVLSVIGTVSVDANLGDQLASAVEYGPPQGDAHPADNAASCTQVVVGALDPNDKHVSPQGNVPSGQLLTYQLDFQNVGTAAATNIRVEDPLDENLDLATLTFGSTSHPATQAYVNGRTVTWTFNNIDLPDSTSSEPLSHGFVTFQVRARTGLPSGQQIVNGGRIYFDFAPAVATNLVTNTVLDQTTVDPPAARVMEFGVAPVSPMPARGAVEVRYSLPSRGELSVRIYDASGRLVRALAEGGHEPGTLLLTWDRQNDLGQRAGAGVYFLRSTWVGENGRATVGSRMVLLE